MSLSIRWRMTLWNTLALAALLVGFAGLVYALVIHALYEQADKVLLGGFHELEHDDHVDLPRIGFGFNRRDYGRLRQLIDVLNSL